MDFMLVVWAVGAAVTYLMLSVTWFMETIGFLAVFTEAMLGKEWVAGVFSTWRSVDSNCHLYFGLSFQAFHSL